MFFPHDLTPSHSLDFPKNFVINIAFASFLLRFFKIFGRYARSGYPMDCNTFHSLSLTQNITDVISLPLGKVCSALHRTSEKLLRVSPQRFRSAVGSPFPARLYHIPCRRIKGRRSYLCKNFFLHTGKNFLNKSPPHVVSLDFSLATLKVVGTEVRARPLSLHLGGAWGEIILCYRVPGRKEKITTPVGKGVFRLCSYS